MSPASISVALVRQSALQPAACRPVRLARMYGSKQSPQPRGREAVKFPWVWPAEAHMVLNVGNSSVLRGKQLSSLPTRLMLKMATTAITKGIFSSQYIETMRSKLVPLALTQTAEAISQKENALLDQTMTRYLAKMYKHAIADIRSKGYDIQIKIDDIGSAELRLPILQMGPAESFDEGIPFSKRLLKYIYTRTSCYQGSYLRPNHGPQHPEKPMAPPKSLIEQLATDEVCVKFLFEVTANVEVELYRKGRLVDADEGAMKIPICFSTPTYQNIPELETAFKGGERAKPLEPFRWSISDMFHILLTRQLVQATKPHH
ncbi:hypothetical protein GGI07_004547 [Coemansia sp. Benny D115]|nr:hypothetical protein GGI07_004547 [Coemansia sp. Benny D115]